MAMAATGKQSGLSFARVVSGGNFSQQQEDLDQQSVPDETPIFTTDIQSSLAQVDLQIDDRSNTNESVQTQTGDSSDWPSLNETSIPTNQKDDDDIHSKNKKPLCPDADQDNNALTVNVEDTDENSQTEKGSPGGMKKKKSWKKVDIEVGRYDSKFKKKSYEPRTHHQRDENNSEESERHVKSFHQRRFDEEQTRRPNDGSEKPGYRDKTGKDQANYDPKSNGYYYKAEGNFGWRKGDRSLNKHPQNDENIVNGDAINGVSGTFGKSKANESSENTRPFEKGNYRSKDAKYHEKGPKQRNQANVGGGDRSQSQSSSTSGARQVYAPRAYNNNRQRNGQDYWNNRKGGGRFETNSSSDIKQHSQRQNCLDEEKKTDDNVTTIKGAQQQNANGPENQQQQHDQQHNRSDRWNSRNGNQNQSNFQRRYNHARHSPLLCWDQASEFAATDPFDYVNYMYQTAVQPMDPNLMVNPSFSSFDVSPFGNIFRPNEYFQSQNRVIAPTIAGPILLHPQLQMTVPISFHSAPVIQQSVVPPQQNTSDDEFGTGIQQQQKVPPDPSSLFSVSGPDSTTSSLIYTTSTVPSNTTSLLAPIPQMPQAYFATPMGVVMTAPPPQAFDQVPATVPAPYPTPLTHPAVLSPLPHQVFQTTATTTPFVALFDDSNLRLREHVRIQIEYYFSAENLQNDLFLRRNMDAEGFLPLCMVASFPRVQLLTQDTNLIIASLCNSQVVEFNNNGSKLRPRLIPQHWPILPSNSSNNSSRPYEISVKSEGVSNGELKSNNSLTSSSGSVTIPGNHTDESLNSSIQPTFEQPTSQPPATLDGTAENDWTEVVRPKKKIIRGGRQTE